MLLCGFMGIDSPLKPTSSENLGKNSFWKLGGCCLVDTEFTLLNQTQSYKMFLAHATDCQFYVLYTYMNTHSKK